MKILLWSLLLVMFPFSPMSALATGAETAQATFAVH